MRRAFVPVLVVALLFLSLAEVQLVSSGIYDMEVAVQSPENRIYTQRSIAVDFTVSNFPFDSQWHILSDSGFTFFLDGEELDLPVSYSISGTTFLCRAMLLDVQEGKHLLVVVVTAEPEDRGAIFVPSLHFVKASVSFTVNAAAPRVFVLSPEPAKAYDTTELRLEFTVSEPVTWLSYSLDGATSVTITGNTTVSGLAKGTHNIVVQAEDSAGSVGESSLVTFTVETAGPEQPGGSQPAPSSTTLVAIAIASAAIIAFGLVAYFLLRKKGLVA
jgi:hypothetical protein